MQITKNFSWAEFKGGSGLDMVDASPKTLAMVGIMADTLETVRAAAGKPISIVGGIRTAKSAEAMRKAGSNPSNTSDHFYGENPAVPLAVGAVDIQCPGMNIKDLFNLILQLKWNGKISTGQVLLEHNPVKGSWWVHVANDPRLVLSPEDLAKRTDSSINLVAVSLDNGKSFKAIPKGGYYEA